MATQCPTGFINGCQQVQALVDQTPKFSDEILKDVRPTEPWVGHVETATVELGTPTEITKDRFRHVAVNDTKTWTKTQANGAGCNNNCVTEHQIGWGSDRLTFWEADIHWGTPLMDYKQLMHISQAEAQIEYNIDKIFRPATLRIHSVFLMKNHLYWSDNHWAATPGFPGTQFTFGSIYGQNSPLGWGLAGANNDEEQFFDCNIPPSQLYKLVPQMLMGIYMPLMQTGYGGENPFSGETGPQIELIADNDVIWDLDKLGGQGGVGGGSSPSVLGNWRFQNWGMANKYWKYGFTGSIGNFNVRMDTGGMRLNYVTDLGANYAPNRYRYQWISPLINYITTGAGGAAGLGSKVNPAWTNAQIRFSQIMHPKGMRLLYREESSINSETTFMHQNMGGDWQFVTDNLGADVNGCVIENKRRDRGQFIADFYNYAEPGNTEWLGVFLHKSEQCPVPFISPVAALPLYPPQSYRSSLPECPVASPWLPVWNLPIVPPGTAGTQGWGPTNTQDGPINGVETNVTLPPSQAD